MISGLVGQAVVHHPGRRRSPPSRRCRRDRRAPFGQPRNSRGESDPATSSLEAVAVDNAINPSRAKAQELLVQTQACRW